MDPYIGIKQDRDDDDDLDDDELRSIGVFVNDSESFIEFKSTHSDWLSNQSR